MEVKLGETLVLGFITANYSTGVATDDDATPSCEVFEGTNDTAMHSPTPVKRTGKTGVYRVSVVATSGNGFEINKFYTVVVIKTVAALVHKEAVLCFVPRTNSIDDVDTVADSILVDTNEIQGKLPTNKFMGSSDVNNHDTDIDAILTDTNEIQGKLPTNKFMGSSDVADYNTVLKDILYGDMIYLDSVTGTNNTAWPYGTPGDPVDTLANAKTIADSLNLRKLHLFGAFTLGAAMRNYSFYGGMCLNDNSDNFLFDLNAKDVDNSGFYNLLITGEQGAGSENVLEQAYFKDCVLLDLSRVNANIVNCMISKAIAPCIYNENFWIDCTFGDVVTTTEVPTITVGEVTDLHLINARGQVIIAGMTGGNLYVHGQNGLVVTINSSCNAGTIHISGDCQYTDNSTGSLTVTDNTFRSDVTDILTDTNEMQGKLPTNYLMGSSDVTDHDDDIAAIVNKLPANYIMGSSDVNDHDIDITNMATKLPVNFLMGSSDNADHDTDIDAILVDTNEIQGKVPTNYLMGSSDVNDHDADIDAILVDTGTTLPASIANLITRSKGLDDIHDDLVTVSANTDLLANQTYGLSALQTLIDNCSDDAEIARIILYNKMTIDESGSKLQVWNDAGGTVLYEWPLTDRNAASISLTGTGPINRGNQTK